MVRSCSFFSPVILSFSRLTCLITHARLLYFPASLSPSLTSSFLLPCAREADDRQIHSLNLTRALSLSLSSGVATSEQDEGEIERSREPGYPQTLASTSYPLDMCVSASAADTRSCLACVAERDVGEGEREREHACSRFIQPTLGDPRVLVTISAPLSLSLSLSLRVTIIIIILWLLSMELPLPVCSCVPSLFHSSPSACLLLSLCVCLLSPSNARVSGGSAVAAGVGGRRATISLSPQFLPTLLA